MTTDNIDYLDDWQPAGWTPSDDDAPESTPEPDYDQVVSTIARPRLVRDDETSTTPRRSDRTTACDLQANDTSDISNAVRFATQHRDDVRFVEGIGTMVWDTCRWRVDNTNVALRMAMDTAVRLEDELTETAEQETDPKKAASLVQSAKSVKQVSRLKAMLTAASAIEGMSHTPEQLDADPMLLNTPTAVIDLRTGQPVELDEAGRRDLLMTKQTAVGYDPAAECPTWLRFIDDVTCGDKGLARFQQKLAGYSFTGKVTEQVLAVHFGLGGNGKSVFFEALLELLGDYGKVIDTDTLMATNGDKHPTGLMDLRGTRLAGASESGETQRLDEKTVKSIAGDAIIKARYMRQDFVEFPATHQVHLMTNHKPVVRGTDNGIWRRLRLIPWLATFSGDKRDPEMASKLRAELPGILNWVLQGALMWQQEGLGTCDAVEAATAEYRSANDMLGAFLDECVIDHAEAYVMSQDLYDTYRKWATDNGERYILAKRSLGNQLADRGWTQGKKQGGRMAWLGHGLALDGKPF